MNTRSKDFPEKHVLSDPFPVATRLGIVVDEVCRCGRLRSEHGDTISYGHGACVLSGCPKFSWKAFVFPRHRN